tara:strand:- start:113 stop:640 length:528 start_codon:yes stop_codon:yes gene_type:complete
MKFKLERILLDEAAAFTAKHHRHSKPLSRHKFSIGALDSVTDQLVGICTVDVPSSKYNRLLDHVEIRRVCTIDDNKNAASFLIGHACNACFSMGYTTIISYTQPHESGISLLASGFEVTKAAKLSFYADDHFEGGLITWKKHKDYQYCPEVRQRSKQWIKERHEFIEKCRSKKWN